MLWTIFLMPPSFAELERRLKERRLEDDETIRMRLAIAKKRSRGIATTTTLSSTISWKNRFRCSMPLFVPDGQSRSVRKAGFGKSLIPLEVWIDNDPRQY